MKTILKVDELSPIWPSRYFSVIKYFRSLKLQLALAEKFIVFVYVLTVYFNQNSFQFLSLKVSLKMFQ